MSVFLAGLAPGASGAPRHEQPQGRLLSKGEARGVYLKALSENRKEAQAAALARMRSDPNAIDVAPIAIHKKDLVLRQMLRESLDPAYAKEQQALLQEESPVAYHQAVMIARDNDRFFQQVFQPFPGFRRPQPITIDQRNIVAMYEAVGRWLRSQAD